MDSAKHIKPVIVLATILLAAIVIFGNAKASFAAQYEKPVLVAHGGGTVEGYDTTNSIEAVMQSIAEGYELIELDFDFSQDGKIIMLHDWNRTATYYFGRVFDRRLEEKEFEKILINGKFHTLTFEKLKPILDEAPHVRIVTDVKGDNIQLLTQIAENDPEYVARMIPQIYSYDQYNVVKALGYDDIILTLYAMPVIEYDELLQFTRQKDLYAVTVGDGYDWIIKDLKYKLAKDGVLVYYHPVDNYETARELMEGGVYGVYASKLTPDEFEEPQRTFYLLDGKAKLLDMKTEDKSMGSIINIGIKNGDGRSVEYEIDGEKLTSERIEKLSPGIHELNVLITVRGKTARLSYILWAADDCFRILDQRMEYRVAQIIQPPEMEETLRSAANVSPEIRELLMRCLVAKAGEPYAYNDGNIIEFQVNGEPLYAQKYYDGSVLAPLAECAKAMGAVSVTMDSKRFVYVFYGNTRTMMQANTFYISQGLKSKFLNTPLFLYRNKTMASGEILNMITGRAFIDNQSLLVILPENTTFTQVDQADLFEAAELLYERLEN